MRDADERECTELLDPVREAGPVTPGSVSVQRAIRDGRHRTRLTRTVGTAIGGAVVAALTIVAAVGVPALLTARPGPADTAQPVAGAEFELFREEFRVGSAGGFTPVAYESGRYRHRVQLAPESPAEGRAVVSIFATGRHDPPEGAPAPDVHGRRAWWLPRPAGANAAEEVGIAWEWAPGAYAFAHVSGGASAASPTGRPTPTGPSSAGSPSPSVGSPSGGPPPSAASPSAGSPSASQSAPQSAPSGWMEAARQRAHRVAQSVVRGSGAPLAVPFTMPRSAVGDPDRLVGVIRSATTAGRPAPQSVALLFGRTDRASDDDDNNNTDRLLVGLRRDPTTDPWTGRHRKTPGPGPGPDRTAAVPDPGGATRIAEAGDPAVLARIGGAARLTQIATSVRPVTNLDDPRTWVTDPLR